MSVSRDDTIIAIRSAFLKKNNQQKFSLLTLIVISIIILVLNSFNFKIINYIEITAKEIIYRSSSIVSAPERYISKLFDLADEHLKIYSKEKKYENLEKRYEVEKLFNEYLVSENDRLRKIIEDENLDQSKLIGKVLLDKRSPFLNSIILNKGSRDGVKLGKAVLKDNLLIGKIIELNYSTSRAILLTDINSKIPSIIEPIGIHTIVSGNGKDLGKIEYIKDEFKIKLKEGDNVYTSGVGGIFRSGLPIGKIKIDQDTGKLFVEFFSKFSQLDYVKIVLTENNYNE